MTEKLMALANKLGTNRYLSVIRDSFISVVPLTISASFAILINSVLFASNLPFGLTNPDYWGEGVINVVRDLKFIFSSIEYGSLNIMSFLIVIGISYLLSKRSEMKNPLANALIIFGVFYSFLPKGNLVGAYFLGGGEAFDAMENAVLLSNFTTAKNLFTAIIVAIVFTELLIWLQGIDKLEIKLPDQVPPAVANSFSALIPAFITFFIAGLIAYFFMMVKPLGHPDLSSFISGVIQAPFLALAKTPLGGWGIMFIYVFFVGFLWIFGIHGSDVLGGFSQPTLGTLQLDNLDLFNQTGDAMSNDLAIFTSGFTTVYVFLGGGGATLALIIAIFIASKRADYKAIANLSFMPGIFEINEPVIFGIPIVLNPIMAIPFVLAPMVMVILPGILTQIGWLPKVVLNVPWVTPPIISAFLATGASWKAAFVAAINLVIAVLIYLPFVHMANKEAEANEAANANEQ